MNTSLVRLSLGYFCLAMLWILLGDTLLGQLVSGDGQAQMARAVRDAALCSCSVAGTSVASMSSSAPASAGNQPEAGRRGFRQHPGRRAGHRPATAHRARQPGVLADHRLQHRGSAWPDTEALRLRKHDAAFYRQMWQALQEDGVWSGDLEPAQEWRGVPAMAESALHLRQRGQLSHYVAVFSDLSALKRSREELDQLAHFDPLVNLPEPSALHRARQAGP